MKIIPYAIVFAACAAVRSFSADQSPGGPSAATKTHVIFMGLDLDWQQGKELHRVQGIRGRSAVVSWGKGEQTVAMGRDNNTFKVVNSLKLGKPAVRLEQVKLDRFYTAANNPQARFMEAFALSTAAADEVTVAEYQARYNQHLEDWGHKGALLPYDAPDGAKELAAKVNAFDAKFSNLSQIYTYGVTTMMGRVNPTALPPLNAKTGFVTLGQMEIKETDVAVTAKAADSDAAKAQPSATPAGETASAPTAGAGSVVVGSGASAAPAVAATPTRAAAAKPGVITDTSGEWCDALELKFEISAEKLIADPYVVIVLNYVDPQDPAKPRQWVHAQQLEPLGPTPRQVHLRHGGFPPGFMPRTPSIHIYDRGRELATSAAGGMALTRDEAMEYLVVEYLSTNKKATLAASPIPASFPENLAARLQATRFPKEVFVSVSADGVPLDMFADSGRRRRFDDPAVRETITEMRFYPALEKGKSIEGMARLAFAEALPSAGRLGAARLPTN